MATTTATDLPQAVQIKDEASEDAKTEIISQCFSDAKSLLKAGLVEEFTFASAKPANSYAEPNGAWARKTERGVHAEISLFGAVSPYSQLSFLGDKVNATDLKNIAESDLKKIKLKLMLMDPQLWPDTDENYGRKWELQPYNLQDIQDDNERRLSGDYDAGVTPNITPWAHKFANQPVISIKSDPVWINNENPAGDDRRLTPRTSRTSKDSSSGDASAKNNPDSLYHYIANLEDAGLKAKFCDSDNNAYDTTKYTVSSAAIPMWDADGTPLRLKDLEAVLPKAVVLVRARMVFWKIVDKKGNARPSHVYQLRLTQLQIVRPVDPKAVTPSKGKRRMSQSPPRNLTSAPSTPFRSPTKRAKPIPKPSDDIVVVVPDEMDGDVVMTAGDVVGDQRRHTRSKTNAAASTSGSAATA